MKVLVVGGGGREHALAWKAAQSSRVEAVFVAPGNAGTALEPKVENVEIGVDDISELVRFAEEYRVDLTIVGPEAPLCAGIADAFQTAGLRCFGPSKMAAELERSKSFAKAFMARHQIPTAHYATFSRTDDAIAYVEQHGAPIVIKADGLAAGKGVVIAQDTSQAVGAIEDMLTHGAFGGAGHTVVIEEFLEGEEASFIVMTDGEHVLPLASSQDHKARDEGDRGPNTGGMGAYSPARVVSAQTEKRILEQIIEPLIRGMAAEERPYRGFLYAGLMVGPNDSLHVLEFNCRLGDPETQPILMRLRSDLVDLCDAAMDGTLERAHAEWDERVALGVVIAAEGYPANYRTGDVITGLTDGPQRGTKIFHAGTAQQDGRIVTAGGRVLCACALGESVTEAQLGAYQCVDPIHWDGMYFRRDIGHRAIARER